MAECYAGFSCAGIRYLVSLSDLVGFSATRPTNIPLAYLSEGGLVLGRGQHDLASTRILEDTHLIYVTLNEADPFVLRVDEAYGLLSFGSGDQYAFPRLALGQDNLFVCGIAVGDDRNFYYLVDAARLRTCMGEALA